MNHYLYAVKGVFMGGLWMKFFIEPKYQYFILPFTFVFITVIAVLNFILNKEVKVAIKILLSVMLKAFFFLIFIPFIFTEVLGVPYLIGNGLVVYFNIISLILGINIIRLQKSYSNE